MSVIELSLARANNGMQLTVRRAAQQAVAADTLRFAPRAAGPRRCAEGRSHLRLVVPRYWHNASVFERRTQPLAHPRLFARRLAMSFAFGSTLIAISLLVGIVGYHSLVGLPWSDAFLNASMILSGMGPLASPQTFAGKVFAGMYALYSGLALIIVAGIIFAPVVHRLFHRFHLEVKD